MYTIYFRLHDATVLNTIHVLAPVCAFICRIIHFTLAF